MEKTSTPFEELSEQDQKIAIELAAIGSLLVTRLPMLSNEVFDVLTTEFAATYNIPANLAKYAMRSISKELFKTSWDFTIKKNLESEIHTEFVPGASIENNGDPLNP